MQLYLAEKFILIWDIMMVYWLEYSAYIWRFRVRVFLMARYFLSQQFWHFQKNICVYAEMNAVANAQLTFQMQTLIRK